MYFREYSRASIEHLVVTGTAQNSAANYGVSVEYDSDNVWRVALVHHLLPSENRGKHNVYIEVLDKKGQRVSGLEAAWEWYGQLPHEPSPPISLDKGDDEPAGNLPIFKGQRISVWISGESSDKVHNLHTMHADEGDGNTWGHHSFYVVFQRAGSSIVAPPVDDDVEARLARLEKRIADLDPLERWAMGLSYKQRGVARVLEPVTRPVFSVDSDG